MAIGTVEFDLSMVNPDTGLYNTARLYTIDGVNNVDGTPRELSIGQLVMAICLQRASQLENGYDDPVTGEHVNGIIDLMNNIEHVSAQLEAMTTIESAIIEEFQNDTEMKSLSDSFTIYIHQCQESGWQRKDAFDWQAYQDALDALTPTT